MGKVIFPFPDMDLDPLLKQVSRVTLLRLGLPMARLMLSQSTTSCVLPESLASATTRAKRLRTKASLILWCSATALYIWPNIFCATGLPIEARNWLPLALISLIAGIGRVFYRNYLPGSRSSTFKVLFAQFWARMNCMGSMTVAVPFTDCGQRVQT